MNVVAERGVVVDGVNDVFDEVARVRSDETNAADAVDFPDGAEQAGEVPAGGRRIAVAVYVLAEKLDLDVAYLRQFARFLQDAFAGPAALRPPRERHNTIGARFVAAFDDGDVRAMRIIAAGERGFESFVGIENQAGDAAVAGFELHQHLGKLRIAGRAGDQAHMRGALEDPLTFLLGHAAEDSKHFALAMFFLELLQPVKDLLLGFIADAA